ncbi:hypothetical protein [Streptomyces seoulensis]|uniref:hypothetical protein n=1 Tax=Streptomyces seoulensis TaxID=73044 RepID=UPI0004CC988A|nr:hypothetical protein [Streptomyces seoulensis]
MTRTRTTASTAKKTTSSAQPAKKTAKKATPAKTAAARKTTAAKKTPAPRLSLVNPPTTNLPTRHTPWMTDLQGYATLAARIAGIHTPHIRDWHDHRNGTTTRRLPDNAVLHYTLNTRTLTWQGHCPMGALHQYEIANPSDTTAARVQTATCTTPHTDLSHIQGLSPIEWQEVGIDPAVTLTRPLPGAPDTRSITIPLPTRPRALGDQLTHSAAGTDDTQPIPAIHPATDDAPKEHPQP